jgi:A/G-specific adenine glycosylase
MLQQTQVDRVIPYYKAWMQAYPTPAALAEASLADVLMRWQGLGYNRRAKMLHLAAQEIVHTYKGNMPTSVEELESLPGVGPYTARAVAAFAYNQDVIFVETNIRTAVIHHFFTDQSDITDAQVTEVLTNVFPKGRAREWYGALMDYGSFLKRSGVRINAKSKGYIKQAAFKGSGREIRGAILRALTDGKKSSSTLQKLFPSERSEQVTLQLERLLKEGLVQKKYASYSLPH